MPVEKKRSEDEFGNERVASAMEGFEPRWKRRQEETSPLESTVKAPEREEADVEHDETPSLLAAPAATTFRGGKYRRSNILSLRWLIGMFDEHYEWGWD